MSSSWAQLIAQMDRPVVVLAALTFVLLVLAHLGLNWSVRRKAAQGGAAADDLPLASGLRSWLPRGYKAIAAPLALLLWIQGLYVILTLLLLRFGGQTIAGPAQDVLGWAYRLAVVAGMFWLLARAGRLVESFLLSLATRTESSWDDLLLPVAGKAARRGLPLLALILGLPAFQLSPVLAEMVGNATSLLLVGLVSYILYQIVDVSAAFILRQHRIDVSNNLQARSIYTQVTVLKKVAVATIGVFTLASVLMVFDSVRQFGASILASAGLAGIVVGFAAQKSIATLLAGFQIALTQPIRLDDVVIVEGEWGRIEEITLTYVVVRIWDLRRLVVPITYFIEQPFQNWTRSSANILGTVFFYTDYTIPVGALREELSRILKSSRYWDGQVNVLQVTDAREHTLEIRALASAADASLAWDLRCEVREKLVAFVQQHHPACLPKFRASFEAMPVAGESRAGVAI